MMTSKLPVWDVIDPSYVPFRTPLWRIVARAPQPPRSSFSLFLPPEGKKFAEIRAKKRDG
jgi:hypothetical protein